MNRQYWNLKMSGEKGRSLLETLSVLAVMALFGILGILFFQDAVNRHAADRIYEDVAVTASAALNRGTMRTRAGMADVGIMGNATRMGKGVSMIEGCPENAMTIKVDNVDKGTCEYLMKKKWSTNIKPTAFYRSADFNGLCNGGNSLLGGYYMNSDADCTKAGAPDKGVFAFVFEKRRRVCALNEGLAAQCTCPRGRTQTDGVCGECSTEEEIMPWVQPNFESNTSYGTLTASVAVGGNSPSASTCGQYSHPAWCAFDGTIGNMKSKWFTDATSANIVWHLPTQLKVSEVTFYNTNETNFLSRFPSVITVSGSSDGSSWVQLGSISGYTKPGSAESKTVSCNSAVAVKYLKFDFENNQSIAISEIRVTAQEVVGLVLNAATGKCERSNGSGEVGSGDFDGWVVDGDNGPETVPGPVGCETDANCNAGNDCMVCNPDTQMCEAGCTYLSYLESSGTQYIDTGIYANQNTEIELSARMADNYSTAKDGHLFGASTDYNSNSFEVSFLGNNLNEGFVTWGGTYSLDKWWKGQLVFQTIRLGKKNFVVDGAVVKSFSNATFTTPVTVRLFTMHRTAKEMIPGKVLIRFAKMYDNGVLVRDFVPVYASFHPVGTQNCMFDRVSKKLFCNEAGGQDFIAGTGTAGGDAGNENTSTPSASSFTTENECTGAGYTWCSGSSTCSETTDCCAGQTVGSCQICDTATGTLTNRPLHYGCDLNGNGQIDGYCGSGDGVCNAPKTRVCVTNADCEGLEGGVYYCFYNSYDPTTTCTEDPVVAMNGRVGTCTKIAANQYLSYTMKDIAGLGASGGTKTLVRSGETMDWWAAVNYCAVLSNLVAHPGGGNWSLLDISNNRLECYNASHQAFGDKTSGLCCSSTATACAGDDDLSEKMSALKEIGLYNSCWVKTAYDSCKARYLGSMGNVLSDDRGQFLKNVLCE